MKNHFACQTLIPIEPLFYYTNITQLMSYEILAYVWLHYYSWMLGYCIFATTLFVLVGALRREQYQFFFCCIYSKSFINLLLFWSELFLFLLLFLFRWMFHTISFHLFLSAKKCSIYSIVSGLLSEIMLCCLWWGIWKSSPKCL